MALVPKSLSDALGLGQATGILDGLGGIQGVIDPIQALGGTDLLTRIGNAVHAGDLLQLDQIETLFPPGLRGPDSTGEVPTGASSITRAEADLDAALTATARIVLALGPQAETVQTEGHVLQVVGRYQDPTTGFDAIHLRDIASAQDVFVTDGLEVGSDPDTVAALTLGRTQATSPEFARMINDAEHAAVVDGRALAFVGPSLGGALAQVAAYETAETLLIAGVNPGTGAIRLLTVDSLGGRDATEHLQGHALDPAALGLLNAVNLRTDGDIISRIGSDIGDTITFEPVNSQGQPVTLSAAEAHVNVESYLATLRSDALFAAGKVGPPAEISGFALLSNTAADPFVALAHSNGILDSPEGNIPLQVPGIARFDAAGTQWVLDADKDGLPDLAIGLSGPLANASDFVFG